MKKFRTSILIILGLISVAIAYIYFSHTAGKLPSFFPGHLAGSIHKHTKHGIAFIILAIVLFIGAWMLSGSGGTKYKRDEKKDRSLDREA